MKVTLNSDKGCMAVQTEAIFFKKINQYQNWIHMRLAQIFFKDLIQTFVPHCHLINQIHEKGI